MTEVDIKRLEIHLDNVLTALAETIQLLQSFAKTGVKSVAAEERAGKLFAQFNELEKLWNAIQKNKD